MGDYDTDATERGMQQTINYLNASIESLRIQNSQLERQVSAVRTKNTELEIVNRSFRDGEFSAELARARKKFPIMASAHEGYAVILEELDELWEIVKQKQSDRDYAAMRKEVVQLGAMVLGFLVEICDAENRR